LLELKNKKMGDFYITQILYPLVPLERTMNHNLKSLQKTENRLNRNDEDSSHNQEEQFLPDIPRGVFQC
jgi:hypothetical protein